MDIFEEFKAYSKRVSLTRVRNFRSRKSNVPDHLKEAYQVFMDALIKQLNDPDEESIDSLGSNAYHNAMVAVKLKYIKPLERKGNCPRCGGTGYILAYSHIKGGKCLLCDGTGK